MPDRKKILFISSWLSTRILPNNANFVDRHAAAVALYNDVYLLHVAFDPNIKSNKREFVEVIEDGVFKLFIYLGITGIMSIFKSVIKPFLFYSNYLKGYKYIAGKAGRIDVVHANIIFPIGIIAWLFKKKFKMPYIISEHWSGYMPESETNISCATKYITGKVIGYAGRICPVSNALGDAISKIFPNAQITRVPNVVNTDIFKPGGQKNDSGKLKIIHISSIYPVKNVEGILSVVKKISAARNDFELHIVQEIENPAIIKLSEDLGLLNRMVFFYSQMSQRELAQTINSCDFMVMFSHTESFSLVVAEALACGKPVVASNVGGMKEHISEKTGILVEAGNEEDLEMKFVYMMDHYNNYSVQEMREYVLENFSYQKVGRQFTELYSEVL
jgi:glycosyltransferase involved in cell wall biosynthesis